MMENYIKLNEYQSILLIGLDTYEISSVFKILEDYQQVSTLLELYIHIKESKTVKDVVVIPVLQNENTLYIIQKVIQINDK